MTCYDVFNGDADGLCALHQLRLARPREAQLVTGLKRDIALLERVPAGRGDSVTVLDVSLHRNREALCTLLERGVAVEYFDHHFAGAPLAHPGLALHVDTSPDVCTSVLVDRELAGAHRLWAAVGAFGDNLGATAGALLDQADVPAADREALRRLGEALNYNAYGETEADQVLPAGVLYRRLQPWRDPFAFIAHDPLAAELARRQHDDLACAREIAPQPGGGAAVYLLPDEPWARRVQGVFANELARSRPQHAHAVLRTVGERGWQVSVRAPLACPDGADTLCLRYPGGGGRRGAAGIDLLPPAQLDGFVQALRAAYPGDGAEREAPG